MQIFGLSNEIPEPERLLDERPRFGLLRFCSTQRALPADAFAPRASHQGHDAHVEPHRCHVQARRGQGGLALDAKADVPLAPTAPERRIDHLAQNATAAAVADPVELGQADPVARLVEFDPGTIRPAESVAVPLFLSTGGWTPERPPRGRRLSVKERLHARARS